MHRIDKETSGLVRVRCSAKLDLKINFACTRCAAVAAIARAALANRTIFSRLVQDRGSGRAAPRITQSSVRNRPRTYFSRGSGWCDVHRVSARDGAHAPFGFTFPGRSPPGRRERVYAKNNPHPTIAAPRSAAMPCSSGDFTPSEQRGARFRTTAAQDMLELLARLRKPNS